MQNIDHKFYFIIVKVMHSSLKLRVANENKKVGKIGSLDSLQHIINHVLFRLW